MKFWVFRFFVLSRPPQVPILLISIQISCTLFIWFVFNDLLQSIYFRRFCSKQLIIFVKTYLLSCRFHCIDIFYIKFRFCEAVIVVNFVTRILLIKNGLLSNQVARKLDDQYSCKGSIQVLDQCVNQYLHWYSNQGERVSVPNIFN